MNRTLMYLEQAIVEYKSQEGLAQAIQFAADQLGITKCGKIGQRRISLWLNKTVRVPDHLFLPIYFALKRAGIKVRLSDLNSSLYPETQNPKWLRQMPMPAKNGRGSQLAYQLANKRTKLRKSYEAQREEFVINE